jgi:hypothetical protein
MKKMALCSALLLLLASCNQPEENIEAKIRDFYSWYIIVNDTTDGKNVSKDTLAKYCTERYLEKFYNDSDIDYDPIISAQDFDKKWVNTLTIAKATAGRDKIYRVSFLTDEKNKISHNIVVTMGKEDGAWKIDYVQANE